MVCLFLYNYLRVPDWLYRGMNPRVETMHMIRSRWTTAVGHSLPSSSSTWRKACGNSRI
ncbi:protein of unknown function (plasmid) [Cupriavidus taiwanensis]|uniref:Uncharacterized protein n=1 Tax=Cupriavidus taiwanensis TaxID=164546 RepID=A0A375EEI2_9BURK|nr:protein of unknown function [Cupriavidus taiwanensis]SOZ72369.1 protein of unknown function [Cupriavidus taiwanensis]SOZ74695.1 protein of unknown function [Cupriavidus taiwanensis]SPA03574.1 protein of unknown function [Cupriavidus taiwanensis]SPA11473.1 protein of unknown function [Cupriavidus taiwanensis]